MTTKDTLGQRISIAMVRKKISGQDLADRLGMSPSNVSLLQSDRHFPRYPVLLGLCRELGLTPNELIGDDYLTEGGGDANS